MKTFIYQREAAVCILAERSESPVSVEVLYIIAFVMNY
jgi:hypothetical protein